MAINTGRCIVSDTNIWYFYYYAKNKNIRNIITEIIEYMIEKFKNNGYILLYTTLTEQEIRKTSRLNNIDKKNMLYFVKTNGVKINAKNYLKIVKVLASEFFGLKNIEKENFIQKHAHDLAIALAAFENNCILITADAFLAFLALELISFNEYYNNSRLIFIPAQI